VRPRTSDFTASLIENIQQTIRDELRTVHTQLEAIADAVRQLSTADVNPEDLMTVAQVAESVKVAATTVRTWIHSGRLRAIRPGIGRGPGQTFRVSRADLKEFVASAQERVPESEADMRKVAAKIVESVARRRKT
jgi:excisionase family DNA binding protein